MSLDIGDILGDWPFKPGEVNVRRIVGDDGREKIQLRLDLGLLQMETRGRPDGQKPFGFSSLLAYYEHQLDELTDLHDTQEGFGLDADACEQLRAEGMMYYHRYLAEFALGDYESVERDTRRNLRMFDFCAAYAVEEYDRCACEQYRSYVLMMHARARARNLLRRGRPKQALAAVRRTIRQIRQIFKDFGQGSQAESSTEISVLRAVENEIRSLVPVDPCIRLRRLLRRAVAEERYEDAAALRDELSRLGEKTADQ